MSYLILYFNHSDVQRHCTRENAEYTNRSAFVFNNLLLLLVALFYDNISVDSMDFVISSTLNGKYEDVLNNLVITSDSLQYLSYLLCGGKVLGEVHKYPTIPDTLGIIIFQSLSRNYFP